MDQNTKTSVWWHTVGRVLLFFVCCAIMLMSASRLAQELQFSLRWENITIGLITAIVSLGLTLLFLRLESMRPEQIGLIPDSNSFLRTVIGFIIGYIMAALLPCMLLITGHIKFVFTTEGMSYVSVGSALFLYLLLSCREQLAFHVYPLLGLNKALGMWAAQFIVAIIFILEHKAGGNTWTNALSAGLGSLLFGMATLSTKGMAIPIGIHAAWNFTQSVLGFKIEEPGFLKGVIQKGYEKSVEQSAYIFYVLIMCSAFLLFYYHWKRQRFLGETGK